MWQAGFNGLRPWRIGLNRVGHKTFNLMFFVQGFCNLVCSACGPGSFLELLCQTGESKLFTSDMVTFYTDCVHPFLAELSIFFGIQSCVWFKFWNWIVSYSAIYLPLWKFQHPTSLNCLALGKESASWSPSAWSWRDFILDLRWVDWSPTALACVGYAWSEIGWKRVWSMFLEPEACWIQVELCLMMSDGHFNQPPRGHVLPAH